MTSKKTNEEIAKILDKYLKKEEQVSMLEELVEVEGNKSFQLSISYLLTFVRDMKENFSYGKVK